MPIVDNSIQEELSPKTMRKAKSLSVREIEPGKWYVEGGSEPHVITYADSYECDCMAFKFGRKCSHILAVELLRLGDSARPVAVGER